MLPMMCCATRFVCSKCTFPDARDTYAVTPWSLRHVSALLGGALADGTLSKESAAALLAVPNLAVRVAEGLGDMSAAPELMLVSVLADDSFSIAKQAPEVGRGQQLLLHALSTAQRSADVLVQTRLLNGEALGPYRPLASAPRMEVGVNYDARTHKTPLFDQVLITLAGALTKSRAAGPSQRVRTFTLLITDGDDTVSASTADQVAALVSDMALPCNHIVAGMGIGDADDFGEVFGRMGIAPEWILASSELSRDIAAKFASLAGSLRLAASSERAFHRLAAGPSTTAEASAA